MVWYARHGAFPYLHHHVGPELLQAELGPPDEQQETEDLNKNYITISVPDIDADPDPDFPYRYRSRSGSYPMLHTVL
jgi:hypothetical protein